MNIPDYLHGYLVQLIEIKTEAAKLCEKAEKRRASWAVIYGLIPFKDENQWCVMLGDNIMEGIVGFGDTPEDAIEAFNIAMETKND